MIHTSWYAFQRHGPKRLEVRQSYRFGMHVADEVVVRVDAVEIARLTAAQLRKGVQLELFDHSVLRLWLESPPPPVTGGPWLMITRNGHPLPLSTGDPVRIVRATLLIIMVTALLQIVIGLLFVLRGVDDRPMDVSLVLGLILIALVALAWHHAVLPVAAAGAVFMGECALYFAMYTSLWNAWYAVVALCGLGWLMLRAIKAARELAAIRLPIRHPPEHAS